MASIKSQSSGPSRLWIWGFLLLVPAVFYGVFIHEKVALIIGFGRVIQPLEDFPWDCQRIEHPFLEGCEDLWLDEEGRKVYAACASLDSRMQWLPGGNKFNSAGKPDKDRIMVLNIDEPGTDGLHGLHELELSSNFPGDLNLHGFDAKRVGDNVRFWFINHKPFANQTTGELLDAGTLGANSTVEVFDLASDSTTLSHVKTIASDAIITPNNLAVDAEGIGFVVSNDHSEKAPGALRELKTMFGTGNLAYCSTDTGKCHVAADKNCNLPNGVAKGKDGRFYVLQSMVGILTVHELVGDKLLQVDQISLGIPGDNISIDKEGNIIVATFPEPLKLIKMGDNPYDNLAPTGILSVRGNSSSGYEIVKLVEDRDATTLPCSTAAVHDVKSDSLFMSGIFSKFVGVCKRRS